MKCLRRNRPVLNEWNFSKNPFFWKRVHIYAVSLWSEFLLLRAPKERLKPPNILPYRDTFSDADDAESNGRAVASCLKEEGESKQPKGSCIQRKHLLCKVKRKQSRIRGCSMKWWYPLTCRMKTWCIVAWDPRRRHLASPSWRIERKRIHPTWNYWKSDGAWLFYEQQNHLRLNNHLWMRKASEAGNYSFIRQCGASISSFCCLGRPKWSKEMGLRPNEMAHGGCT